MEKPVTLLVERTPPGMNRRTLLITTAIILSAMAGLWLFYSTPTKPAPDSAATAGGAAWTGIKLPPPSYSPVERLRTKTVAGNDSFTVETRELEIRQPLKILQQLFLQPDSPETAEAFEGVSTADFKTSPFEAPRSSPLYQSPGISAESEEGFGPPSIERASLAREIRQGISPLETLQRAELKIVGISEENGLAEIDLLFHLAGASAREEQHQWNGQAQLSWDSRQKKFSSFRISSRQHVRMTAKPFTDVTSEVLGANTSYRDILVPSIDHFRRRLDAAVGIGVYGHNGLAIGDANGDGLEDLYVLTAAGLPNLLYRAEKDGTFTDTSREAGVDLLDGTSQALFLDLDNDSDQDLFLVTDQKLAVLLNDGSGRFSHSADAIAQEATGSATPLSATAADYDLDGLVDVYICSYVFWRGGSNSAGTRLPIPYHEAHNGAANILLKNLGGGRFKDMTAESGLGRNNQRFSFAAAWGDYDDDGHPDLYIANDFGSNNLWRNRGDGTFEETTATAGVEDTGAGMSVSWEDYDNDGDLDLYVGNMFSAAGQRVTGKEDYKAGDRQLQGIYRRHARGNSLFSNSGGGAFEDRSLAGSSWFGRWAWGSDFIDFNLDGHEDIYVQNGFLTNSREHDL